jgi:hypothetical protein
MKMRLVYLVSSADDLAWIRRYYASVFPAGKDNAAEQFRKMRAILLSNLGIGKSIGFGEAIRELHIPKTPFS